MSSKELRILFLKEEIRRLKSELCLLCESDYYNQCDLIEIYKQELDNLERESE